MSDPYEVLGLPSTATLDEIKRRYRQLAAKYHPDHGAESWIFKQIRAAYEQLCQERDLDTPGTAAESQPPPPPAEPSSWSAPPGGSGSASTPPPVSHPIAWPSLIVSLVAYWICRTLDRWYLIPWWVFVIGSVCLLTASIAWLKWLEAYDDRSPATRNSWWRATLANGSFLLGLVGLASWMVPLYGWPVAIAGYVCGYCSHTSADRPLALIGMGLALYSFVLTGGTFCYFASLSGS